MSMEREVAAEEGNIGSLQGDHICLFYNFSLDRLLPVVSF